VVTKKTTKQPAKAELTRLTDKQIVDLEKKLTNFITKVRATHQIPIGGGGFLAGHGSHFQQ